MKLASIDAFYDDPKLVWEWYEDRRKNILAAKPNNIRSKYISTLTFGRE
jgi:NAD-dependent deacetylase